MKDKKSLIKIYSFTYGKCCYITTLALAALCFLLGAFFLPNAEGIALLVGGLLFVLLSFCLLHYKYMNYVSLTDKNVSTKKQTFSWDKVYITMSYYFIHTSIKREDYYIFFDDHYLSKEEIYSRKVKKDAFYLMVTPKRLEIILQNYNKKIQLLERCGIDRKGLYDKINEYNKAADNNQESN